MAAKGLIALMTGTLHTWFGWLAKIQFLPALLALNIGVVLFLVVLTLLFGLYVYASTESILKKALQKVGFHKYPFEVLHVEEGTILKIDRYGFLERARDMKRYDFVDTALKILPLLYLKATLLPPCEPIGEDEPETFVTEEDYELIRRAIAGVLGAKDDYLEVFLPDMVYSDTPIKKCISEDLADIYQDLKDFISVFQLGLNETMNDSLVVCKEHFREFWGQRLVNTMRALHDVKYSPADDGEEEEMEDENSLL